MSLNDKIWGFSSKTNHLKFCDIVKINKKNNLINFQDFSIIIK